MFTDPIKNLKAFDLREDNIVADLGAGTGYYTVPLGEMVARGRVYAVEIVPDFLDTIRNRARDARLNNVEIIWGNIEKPEGTKIGNGIVDAVVASNVLFQVEDKSQFIEEIKRILKPQGRVLLIDWYEDSEYLPLRSAIPKNVAKEMFERRDFVLERDINAGMHHYGMILVKQ